MAPEGDIALENLAPSLPVAEVAAFETECRKIHYAIAGFNSEAGMPKRLELVIADDFGGTVDRRRKRVPGDTSVYDSRRPGGVVGAKNLPQDDANDHVVIVFSSQLWTDTSDLGIARRWALVAHELTHPVLARLRFASGAASSRSPWTPTEVCRFHGQTLMDEYRADRIASAITRVVSSVDADGTTRSASLWDLFGRIDALEDLLTAAYQRLPTLIEDYRGQPRTYDEMMQLWSDVSRYSVQVLISYVNALAAADYADDRPAVLGDPRLRDLPFVRAYLGDTLAPLVDSIRAGDAIPTIAEWRRLDDAVVAAADAFFREYWRRLGLTFVEQVGSQSYEIKIAAPTRV
jgi:hypothetical protein